MNAFIITPADIMEGKVREKTISELIRPALKRAGITVVSTAPVSENDGLNDKNIQLLLSADLVVADISEPVHPDIFYALGIRHAFNTEGTILLSTKSEQESGYSAFVYDAENPASEIEKLVTIFKDAMKETISIRKENLIFPGLSVSDSEKFIPFVPADFQAEVQDAVNAHDAGKIALLSEECREMKWRQAAEKILAVASTKIKTSFNPAFENSKNIILFAGHMIDKKDRKEPRFPEGIEDSVKNRMREILKTLKEKYAVNIKGIAGGACGGDIIFHEVCHELGIPTELHLTFLPDLFISTSVGFAGNKWVERFNRLYKQLPVQVMSSNKELPQWLKQKKDYSIWERNNLWMLHAAIAEEFDHLTLLALWDNKGGDSPGGTEHLVSEAKKKRAEVIVINPAEFY